VLLSRFVDADRTIALTTVDGASMIQLTTPPPGWNDMVPVALDDGVVVERMSAAEEGTLYFVKLDGSRSPARATAASASIRCGSTEATWWT
jgi:hypothetical protein